MQSQFLNLKTAKHLTADMRRPLVILCLFFCLGIIFAAWSELSLLAFGLFYAACLVCSLMFIRNDLGFVVFIALASFFLGASLLKNSQDLPDCHISRYLLSPSRPVSLKGWVDSDPLASTNKTSFIFKAEGLILEGNQKRVCGEVLTGVFGNRNFRYGQTLILTGTLYRPFNFALSPTLNYRDYLKRRGIYAMLAVKKNSEIQDLGVNRGSIVMSFSFWLKHEMEAIIDKNLSPIPASILNAMLLGERKAVPRLINDDMIKSGTVHILVVSGFNVGIVAFIVLTFLKVLRIPRRPRLFLAILLLVIYCFLTGASTPVVRATVMGLVLLLGYLIEREPDLYNSLALAAMIILVFNPRQIWDVGFELSFVSVLSIVWLYPKIKSLFPQRLRKTKYISSLIQIFAISFSAWLGTAGLIAYYFKIISPVTVLANMVIVPVTSFITACGFALVMVGKILPQISFLFARSCELTIFVLLSVNYFLINLKGAYHFINPFSIYYVFLYYAIVILLSAGLNIITRNFNRDSGQRIGTFGDP